MFQTLLEKISRVSIAINGRIEEDGDQLINTIIFWKDFKGDVHEYKKIYFRKLRLKELRLLRIEEEVYKSWLSDTQRDILLREIENRLLKLEFLRYIYNTEAQKIDSSVQIHYPYSIEIYNKAFFWVGKKSIWEYKLPKKSHTFPNIYTRKQLRELIKYAKELCPDLQFSFWKYPNFSHKSWVIKIPSQPYYNMQNIITLFFHEVTHFFRTYNGKRNLGFAFQFAGYSSLEEGIAIYNEYKYGNKICDYGSFIPYYDMCLAVLLEDISEQQKKDKIYVILSLKGFDRERSDQYYNRFYKYCRLGGDHLFLKDLIYHKGYKNVKKLIKKSPKNYDRIMSWDIGIPELESWIVWSENNYDYRSFFSLMVTKIRKI